MTPREVVLDLLNPTPSHPYVPAAFFLHFDPSCHKGPAAVQKHLEYFRATRMDLVKIQFEVVHPKVTIETSKDWAHLPVLDAGFYQDQLDVVQGLVEAAKNEAVVVLTLYSPFMIAGQMGGEERLDQDIQQDPESVAKGLAHVTEGLLRFVKACQATGLDGFYHSTQGAEENRFSNGEIFDKVVRPTDLKVMNEIEERFRFNILHVCDYHRARVGGYASMDPFLDYPGHVLSCSTHIGNRKWTPRQLSEKFGRPFLGGMDRLGVLANGTPEEAREAADCVLEGAFSKFFLGADCTVPPTTPWANLAAAIDQAHRTKPGS